MNDNAESNATQSQVTVNVRSAKARLSELLDLAASGGEITITSEGKPKARIMPLARDKDRKPFGGARTHLEKMKGKRRGPSAEEIIRNDRDSRG